VAERKARVILSRERNVTVLGYTPRRLGFDSRRYQIFLLVANPDSLVRINEEILERKSSCSGMKNRD
jgi:hypothetical protein